MEQSAKDNPAGPPDGRRPASPGTSDRGLMIMLIALCLFVMFFVLLAGVVGLTP